MTTWLTAEGCNLSIPQHRPRTLSPYMLFSHFDAAAQAARELAAELRLAARQLSADGDHANRARIYSLENHANQAASLSIRLAEEAAVWQRASDAADRKRRTA